MAFQIPNFGEGDDNVQSILFETYIAVLVAGIQGRDCVLSGCAVTGGADMTPAVAKGAVLSQGVMFAIAAADVTIPTADATNPRLDLIVVNNAGTLTVRQGSAAANPKPVDPLSAGDVCIAVVYVPANDTAIATSQIIDLRVFPQLPACIYRTTTAEITNTTSAVIEALNKTGSGVVIPNGLFLAGRILRVRLYGNMLLNSGTPTVTIAILFGGTTMFSDVSAAAAASATRRAFWIDFDIVAQGNSDQALAGHAQIVDPVTAPVAPTTGTGDIWGINTAAQESQTAYGGAAAVDADAANRTLSVRVTFNVSNVAVELVVEGATVELL